MKILIADDSVTDLLILKTLLKKQGHEIIAVNNGLEAVKSFESDRPEIVLLDVLMPVMDGLEAAVKIKEISGEHFTPIIFLTSLTNDYDLAKCLDSGGDDFLSKPYNQTIINAKLRSFNRMNKLHNTVEEQRDKIAIYNENLVREQKLAKKLFDNIAHPGCIDAPNIKSLISPMSIFNGDIVLSARNPLGGMYIFVGDFTGHGLPAAVGAMPISEIFYGMTVKGFSMPDILKEINNKLKSILPSNIFCCCTMANINFIDLSAEFWMAGMPDIMIYHKEKREKTKISFKNLPLGIVPNDKLNFSTQVYSLNEGDLIYFWTDGISEAQNPEGELFGEHRIEQFFEKKPEPDTLFETFLNTIQDFTESDIQTDDISFVEVMMVKEEALVNYFSTKEKEIAPLAGPMDWSFTYEIRTQSLKTFNPLPMITHILMEIPSLKPHNGNLYTILSEIYSNALEHGILELDSVLKNDPNGFSVYYQERNKKLASLKHGKIIFHVDHIPIDASNGKLIISVSDSGEGFDYQTSFNSANSYSGRGFKLLSELCDTVEYSGNGNIIKVVYVWRN